MSDISSGEILMGGHQGVQVIKMVGDVRLTLCVPFDELIEKLLAQSNFYNVLFDLSETEWLDSTTLGLMAKLAIAVKAKNKVRPLIMGNSPAIQRLLVSMGLDNFCRLIDEPPKEFCKITDFSHLDTTVNDDENIVKAKVLEAHCVLMGLNESNQEVFKDLVLMLKRD